MYYRAMLDEQTQESQDNIYEVLRCLRNRVAELESTIDAMRGELRVAQQERWAREN